MLINDFTLYEKRFKALADGKRLQLLNILSNRGATCVCDLTELLEISQSKLSYHLKILLESEILLKEKRGTWNYYYINDTEVDSLLSKELCCIFRSAK